MRVLYLLLILTVITLILAQWAGDKPPAPAVPPSANAAATPPAVPVRPQELPAFEQDINRFMQDAAAQRANREPRQ
mgnify:CR=1 FL=1